MKKWTNYPDLVCGGIAVAVMLAALVIMCVASHPSEPPAAEQPQLDPEVYRQLVHSYIEERETGQDEAETPQTAPEAVSLGEYRITVYTPYCDGERWGYQTATGQPSRHLATCAVDPNVIALGSVLKVGGLTLTAVDTGSAVKGKTIDIFFDGTRTEAREWVKGFGTTKEVLKWKD